VLREDVKHRTSDGASYSLFVLSSPGSSKGDALGKLDRIRATQLVQEFVKTHVTVLELAATVDWLWRSEGYSDWRDEVTRRKPMKVGNGRLERAVALLEDLGLSPPMPTGEKFLTFAD